MASFQKQEVVAKKMGLPKFSIGVDYLLIGNSDNPMAGSESAVQRLHRHYRTDRGGRSGRRGAGTGCSKPLDPLDGHHRLR